MRFVFYTAIMAFVIISAGICMGAYKRVYMSPAQAHQAGPAEDNWGPVCFMEPSGNENGFVMVRYPMLSDHDDMLGFRIPC